MNGAPLNDSILILGKEIFNLIGEEQPGAFSKNFLPGRLMQWSLTKPNLKVNMFRLVDVLPTLRSDPAVMEHISEYLSNAARDLGAIPGWGACAAPRSLRGWLTSRIVKSAVQQTARLFIAGETPSEAIKPLRRIHRDNLAFTVDLLGEYSVSEKESAIYLERYLDALDVLGEEVQGWKDLSLPQGHPTAATILNVSVKLSALYSQCHPLNFERSVEVLSERLATIVTKAKKQNAQLYVDAEDSGTNPIIYETFKRVFSDNAFKTFPYPGIVLQAYAKESAATLQDLITFARTRKQPIAVRLVKGAYWDQETIQAQQNGWPSPLFSQKESSDYQYEQLSRMLIDNHPHCFPAFGSHNVRSLAHACCYAESKGLAKSNYELQMLYGMAEPIAKAFTHKGYVVRLYVPLGRMLPGMGYLVRRLLENTSNESFLRHTFHDESSVDELLQEPVEMS